MYEVLWIAVPYSVSVKYWIEDMFGFENGSGQSNSLKDIFHTKIKKGIQSLGSDKHVNRFLEFSS